MARGRRRRDAGASPGTGSPRCGGPQGCTTTRHGALDEHADAVDRIKRLIAAIEDRVLVARSRRARPDRRRPAGRRPDRPARRPARPVRAAAVGAPRLADGQPARPRPARPRPARPAIAWPDCGPRRDDDPAVILDGQPAGRTGSRRRTTRCGRWPTPTTRPATGCAAMARLGGRTMGDEDLLESVAALARSPRSARRTRSWRRPPGRTGSWSSPWAGRSTPSPIRGSISLLESADQARARRVRGARPSRRPAARDRAGHRGAALVAGVPLVLAVGGDGLVAGLEDLVTEQPVAGRAPGQRRRWPARRAHGRAAADARPPTTPREVLGDLYPDGDPVVAPVDGTCRARQPTSVEDLLEHLTDVAALSEGSDSPANGTIEIQTITDRRRQVVAHRQPARHRRPRTLPWTADDDVRDLGTNLDLIAGRARRLPAGHPRGDGRGRRRARRAGPHRRALAGRHGGGRDPRPATAASPSPTW